MIDVALRFADKQLSFSFMSDGRNEISEEEAIRFADLAPAIEFACWTIVGLAPFLRLVNGPAVTDDQWWIQVTLTTLALVGACSLRCYQWLCRRKIS